MSDQCDLEQELVKIDDELETIEVQLSELLDRQQRLNERADEIRNILALHDASSTSKSASNDKREDKGVDLSRFDNEDFPWSKRLSDVRSGTFRVESYRPMQLPVMNATLSGQDAMLIMPTGGGKSLCYQLPAMISDGVTLVISPLVSLMEDQIMALHDLNVPAAMLNAQSTKDEVKRVMDAMVDKNAPLKLLYCTPEKISKGKRFMSRVEKMYSMGRLVRIAIDEVHCCSQWGHDFRPDYKILGILKRQFPNAPILGLTATAGQRVLDDVKKILQLPNPLIFRASFNRANLFYEVRPKPSSHKDMVNELQTIIQSRFKNQSGIIYCFSRKETETVCRDLRSRGIKAGFYHAYVEPEYRHNVHKDWISGKVQVIVATVAFGMGIDKPDVRFVIHHTLSKSMENYYQESGRAGRDDQTAWCIVYYRLADLFRQSTMVFTEQTGLDNLYRTLEYCIDTHRCRRAMIARHFSERWDASDCNKMCDHCLNQDRTTIKEVDVTKECAEIVKILRTKTTKEKRITGLELVRLSGQEKGLLYKHGTSYTERLICQMIIDNYLREDFHFTPYNTISYVVLGSRASMLDKPSTSRPILMKFAMKSTKSSSVTVKPMDEDLPDSLEPCDQGRMVKNENNSGASSPSVEVIEIDDDFADLAPPLESLRSTKRKEPKVALESEAKKIRLDCVDGKKKKKKSDRRMMDDNDVINL